MRVVEGGRWEIPSACERGIERESKGVERRRACEGKQRKRESVVGGGRRLTGGTHLSARGKERRESGR